MRAEGKEYVVKDGDVLNFLFNVWLAHESDINKKPLIQIKGFLVFLGAQHNLS
jgi:hypothetical protein